MGSQLLLASTSSKVLLRWGSQKPFDVCLVVYAKFHFFVYCYKQNWQSALVGFHQFQSPAWMGF